MRELGNEVARMLQDCDRKVEKVLFKRAGLQERLDSLASLLSGAFRSLTKAREPFEPHRGRSAASHLPQESFLASAMCSIVDRLARSLSDEVVGHLARPANVVTPASDSMELELQSIVKLLREAE